MDLKQVVITIMYGHPELAESVYCHCDVDSAVQLFRLISTQKNTEMSFFLPSKHVI